MRNEIIKFRAWDGLNKKFTYWTMNDLCNFTDDSIEKPSALDIWLQYTGLKDKNGKEICEGDIIERKKIRVTIRWDNKWGRFNGVYHNKFKTVARINDVDFMNMKLVIEGEIIGNVYENPGLLDK